VTRVGGAVKTVPLEPVGARALAALARGRSFRDACEAAGGELAAHAAATALARAAALGAVTAAVP
jgi:hypothetical protein